ncbi:hypothetical protein NRC25 [Methanocella arvoryzae MRE50]|uniref:Uncharacterized protein n=1 Tax=Methanocella arvoryzae (strain DSM 22066 / NBRC 105507 / MRE50) TaxID=351160 RepID=Q0W0Q6_METAR|nr:hypothetical protein NRC25 [Methanocella arvoryzae MRE50]
MQASDAGDVMTIAALCSDTDCTDYTDYQYPRGVWWWLGGCGLCGVGLVCLSGGGLIYESVLKIGGLIGFC